MKNCKNIKDLILTDYLDGQASPAIRQGIDAHLLNCVECREFNKEVQERLSVPFEAQVKEEVPAELWSKIKDRIEAQPSPQFTLQGILNQLTEFLSPHKLVPAIVSLSVIFLVFTLVIQRQHNQLVREKEQGEYLFSLVKASDLIQDAENNAPETSLEEYFL